MDPRHLNEQSSGGSAKLERLRETIIPNSEQLRMCFIICQSLTTFYRSIDLVRLDQRTGQIIILTGEETQIAIRPNGKWRFE
ncbi:MAG: hypothetical protein ACFCU8_05035 [Thermosynechococcaceae cyanobacterium]